MDPGWPTSWGTNVGRADRDRNHRQAGQREAGNATKRRPGDSGLLQGSDG